MTSACARYLVIVAALFMLALAVRVLPSGPTYSSRNRSVMVAGPVTRLVVLAEIAPANGGLVVQFARSAKSGVLR